MKYYLVYQCGLANVFELSEEGKLRRLFQHAFGPCEYFASGLSYAGADVTVLHCDVAGDIAEHMADWRVGAGLMFADDKRYSKISDRTVTS